MTNTVNSVPRELLADLLGNDHDKRIMAERHLLAMLANAPSPAGVDGLAAVKVWEADADWDDHELVVRLSDAQAIIDGLRGEVEVMTQNANNYSRMFEECAEERDQQAQRIGELEGLLQQSYQQVNSECMDWAKEYERRKEVQAERDSLISMLREFAVGISKREMPTEQELNDWFDRIEAALSAGKEGE